MSSGAGSAAHQLAVASASSRRAAAAGMVPAPGVPTVLLMDRCIQAGPNRMARAGQGATSGAPAGARGLRSPGPSPRLDPRGKAPTIASAIRITKQPLEPAMPFRPLTAVLPCCLCLALSTTAQADQFVLFDDVFLFEEKDAVPTQSHIMVNADKFNKATPKDWTQPVDYGDSNM